MTRTDDSDDHDQVVVETVSTEADEPAEPARGDVDDSMEADMRVDRQGRYRGRRGGTHRRTRCSPRPIPTGGPR